ncbi:fasciclin domain-containing protein [Pyrinomonas sp.]|uniref:fasciclin domain-containing protein n=1 Tax=Pyrinomonas sp. TaxID=2080306 RepID=UPI0033272EC4
MQAAGDIVETATKAGKFSTLVKALEVAGLTETLKGPGPFTVFAPTDEAFAKLPAGTLETLLKPENKEQLRAILLYHVVPGRVTSDDVAKATEAKTAQGEPLRIKASEGTVKVDDATVTQVDITASNGIIHVIDSVLLPKGASKGQMKNY